ncbi:DUF309 domain-containing protein [Ruegeria sediminis]|uniref:DUF309 domain-containing protein n=1 Tax=Ruegeria sediminis TaxID=2583820 RepID=A0ABY2WX28_9RHOB|nr:DUF309 domain-containing protein [Ruegeria sediminis]TMV06961.1 DUF309 domain-containing protein [Ruegeria sediminis]
MELTLPANAYVPGRTARHPEDTFAALCGTVAQGMNIRDIAASDAWRAGWVLLDRGYFWEAHEVWEPVWLHLPPNSAERQFVQACIQFANACLKERMQRPAAALRLCGLARERLAAAGSGSGSRIMGIDTAELHSRLTALRERLRNTAT